MTTNETTEAITRLYPVWIQDSVYRKKDWTHTVVLLSRHSKRHLAFRAVSGNVTVVRFECEQLMREPLVDFLPPRPRSICNELIFSKGKQEFYGPHG